ncbi:MAG TPA: T9SS type A sorting domain-containing protein [Adhaeribacter sp.]|nr:T9SS type A sorting domain-containing protein [Adhaeribacter sp.]
MKKNLLFLFSLWLITEAGAQVRPAPDAAAVKLRRSAEIISAQERTEDKSVSVYPNPSSGVINLSLSGFNGKITTVTVVNVIGTEVYREVLALADGRATKAIDMKRSAPGLYYVKLEADDYSEIRKVVLK